MWWAFGVRHHAERELFGDLGTDKSTARSNPAQRRHQLRRCAFLGQIPGRAGSDRAHRVLVLLVHAQHEHAQLWLLGFDLLDQLHTALPRHRHVEQQDVEIERAHTFDDLPTVAGLADNIEIVRTLKELSQAFAYDRVIVGDDDPDHRRSSLEWTGRRTSIKVPEP